MKIFFAILTVLSVILSFDCSGSNSLKVTEGWARGGKAEGDTTGAYFLITNHTKEPDRLLSVTSTVTDSIQIVETVMVDGAMQPRVIDSLTVPPDKEVRLTPDKRYIKLASLKQPLFESSTIHLTLNFEKAGAIEQSILIEGPQATKFEQD